MKQLKKLLSFYYYPEINIIEPIVSNAASYIIALQNIRFYYFSLLFFSFFALTDWEKYRKLTSIDPVWAIQWITYIPLQNAYFIIIGCYLLSTFLAALFPYYRFFRILVFLGVFFYTAFIFSFGKIDHSLHLWILTSFFLIFLPDKWHEKEKTSLSFRKKFLFIFWACQAIILLTYSMAGLGKILSVLPQLFQGEIHVFAPQAMALLIASRLLETNSTSILGPWIIGHPWVGWALFPGAIYIELFSFFIAFKPNMQKTWGVFLILLHISIYLTMSINFIPTILILALFFLNTPFEQPQTSIKQRLKDIPLFGIIVNRVLS